MPNQAETESADLAGKHVCSQQQGTNWEISSYQISYEKRWELAIHSSPRSTRTRMQKEGCDCSRKKTENFTRSSHRSRWNCISRDPKSWGWHTCWRRNNIWRQPTRHAIEACAWRTSCLQDELRLPEDALPETCLPGTPTGPFQGHQNKQREINNLELLCRNKLKTILKMDWNKQQVVAKTGFQQAHLHSLQLLIVWNLEYNLMFSTKWGTWNL